MRHGGQDKALGGKYSSVHIWKDTCRFIHCPESPLKCATLCSLSSLYSSNLYCGVQDKVDINIDIFEMLKE